MNSARRLRARLRDAALATVAATVLVAASALAPAQADPPGPDGAADPVEVPAAPAGPAAAAEPDEPPLPPDLERLDVPDAPTQPQDDGPETVAAVVIGDDGSPEVITVEAPAGKAEEVAEELAAREDVVAAAVDTPVAAFGHAGDAYRQYQWGLDALETDLLPPVTGAADSLVAVLDTGVWAGHPDLAGRVRCDLGESFTADEERYDPADTGCVDPQGHGTHVAGVVAAVGDNGIGVAGLSAAGVIPVRVLGADGTGESSNIAAGILHAVAVGADVINLSLGGTDASPVEQAAVQHALGNGVVVVAAAGNNRMTGNEVNYPAAFPGVIAVAASRYGGDVARYSYSGPTNLVTAPGTGIVSTHLRASGGYAAMDGTSMAAPHVAGVLVRYRALHPAATVDQVRTAVALTADDLGVQGFDNRSGHGMLDAYQLLTGAEMSWNPSWSEPGTPSLTGAVLGKAAVTVRWGAPARTGGRPVTGYSVEAFRVFDDGSVRLVDVGAGARSATVRGLAKGNRYYFVLWAANAVGYGPPAVTRVLTVPRAPAAPGIGAPTPGNGTVRVRWSAPVADGGSPVTGYTVRAYRGTGLVRTLTTGPAARRLLVGGLGNGVRYTFTVTASNVAGNGRASARSAVAVPRTVPSAPGIGGTSAGPSSATVRWTAPARTGGAAIDAYVVRVHRGTDVVRRVVVSPTSRAATVTGLAPGARFHFTVAARNVAGVGPASARSAQVVPRR